MGRDVRLGVGLSGPYAEVSIPSFPAKWWQFWQRRSAAVAFEVLGPRANLRVWQPDHGELDWSFYLVNYSKHRASLEDIHMSVVRVGQSGISQIFPKFEQQGTNVIPQAATQVFCKVLLQAPDIRQLHAAIGKADNPYSTPRNGNFGIMGHLRVRCRKEDTSSPPRWS